MTSKTQIKQPAKKDVQPCIFCNGKIENGDCYLCNSCGCQLCWDCYDDFHEDKDPYCPECDAELLSDSETQQSDKTPVISMKSAGIKSAQDETTTNGDLAKVRVIKKNLVYIIGLSPEIANEEILMKKEYFGQYGKVSKIVVNTNNAYNPKGSNGPSFSAYVTYSCEREASMAIIGSDEFTINERIIRASYGTTKYCQFFLKQQECPNLPECLYLHAFSKDKELQPKDDITSSKSIFVGQTKMAISNIQKYIPELVKIKNTPINYTPALPSPQSIIQRLIDEELLDIQTPSETQQIDVKVDKKKKEEDKPFIDQWSMDISVPQTQKKKETSNQSAQPQKTVEQQQYTPQQKQSLSMVKSESENKKTQKEGDASSLSSPPRDDQLFKGEKDSIPQDNMNGLSLIHANSSPCSKTAIAASLNSQGIPPNSAPQADSQLTKMQPQSSSLIQNSKSPLEVTMFTTESPAQFVPKNQQILMNDNKQSNSKENSSNSNFKKGKTSNAPSATTSTSNSNVSSTNHSRTSSISQKASSNSVTQQNHQTNNLKYIPQSQMNAYYEKKDITKNINNNSQDTKFVKHQYIPANQAQKSQVQNDTLPKDQNNPQKVESSSIQLNNKQSEKNNSNSSRAAVAGMSCNSPAPSLQNNQQIEENKLFNGEEASNTISQQIEPKYVLKKVARIQRQETPDQIIMKKLIKRTHQKNQASCFEFARQNEAEGQEDLDIIAHIFDGTYLQLTNKTAIKQSKNGK